MNAPVKHPSAAGAARDAAIRTTEPLPVRIALTGLALLFIGLFLVVPLVSIFTMALDKGIGVYVASLTDPDALSAVRLTLLTAGIAVPLNLAFGVTASWAIAKFEFRGKYLLISLIDLPFAVSPVISGLIFVLLFGAGSAFAPWLEAHDVKILFAVPGIVLATIFVTFPFVARELIPVMTAAGTEEEEVALTLGAGGWRTFFTVTLPGISGACSTASYSATPAPWGNSGPCPWYRATSGEKRPPCRSTWRYCTTNTILPPPSPSPPSWRCWPW